MLISSLCLWAQDSEGTKFFKQNQPEKAAPLLEQEILLPEHSPELYNYLGLSYCQLGNYQKAVEAFDKGINAFGTDKKVLYFNQGNAYFSLNNYQKAVDSYSMAIVADSTYTPPYLNRANSYLKLNDIDKCVLDYTKYLELCPNDVQADKIRAMLDLLGKEKEFRIAQQKQREEEAARLKQEEERIKAEKAEQERLAAIRRAEEEERRKKLLEEVANSLKQTSDTTNMSAGAEEILSYEEESVLD